MQRLTGERPVAVCKVESHLDRFPERAANFEPWAIASNVVVDKMAEDGAERYQINPSVVERIRAEDLRVRDIWNVHNACRNKKSSFPGNIRAQTNVQSSRTFFSRPNVTERCADIFRPNC